MPDRLAQQRGDDALRRAAIEEICDRAWGETEIDAVVVDLREFMQAPASERVKRTSELLLRTLELPRPLADRVVRRIDANDKAVEAARAGEAGAT